MLTVLTVVHHAVLSEDAGILRELRDLARLCAQ